MLFLVGRSYGSLWAILTVPGWWLLLETLFTYYFIFYCFCSLLKWRLYGSAMTKWLRCAAVNARWQRKKRKVASRNTRGCFKKSRKYPFTLNRLISIIQSSFFFSILKIDFQKKKLVRVDLKMRKLDVRNKRK